MVVLIRRYIIQFLTLLVAGVWIAIFQIPDANLHIIACDVGQGDAILVTYKNTQILTDGGPNDGVLDCLSDHIPFWDRNIELVISTHPDADHSSGLIEVVKRYNTETILINRLDPGTQVYKALENAVGSRGVRVINPDDGMVLRLGMIQLDILHPLSDFESTKTNEYSIVSLLSYASFEAIFTGDIEQDISNELIINNKIRKVDYIKIPHHGSINGMTENLLKAIEPKIAVISVGAKNPYGHPRQEIIDMLSKQGVKTLRTDEMGDVEVITNGSEYWIKK
jgi:competence protein ComEC